MHYIDSTAYLPVIEGNHMYICILKYGTLLTLMADCTLASGINTHKSVSEELAVDITCKKFYLCVLISRFHIYFTYSDMVHHKSKITFLVFVCAFLNEPIKNKL